MSRAENSVKYWQSLPISNLQYQCTYQVWHKVIDIYSSYRSETKIRTNGRTADERTYGRPTWNHNTPPLWRDIKILYFPENRLWHFMQTFSFWGNFHKMPIPIFLEMSKPIFWEQNKKNIISVVSWNCPKNSRSSCKSPYTRIMPLTFVSMWYESNTILTQCRSKWPMVLHNDILHCD